MARILVIEDNPTNMKLVSLVLDKAGHQVLTADDAVTGLQVINREQPDLVLMDVQLPGMDGLTATRQLRAAPGTRDLRIVALTAFAMPEDAARIRAAGCDAYLTKPVRYRELIDTIDSLLKPA
ncbi:response regulator [Uliginosibacterium sp. sgz301328]|uniref:response regulator n=1 Tax=Uliginosibacterium sp. sgz301328 TaxID=3243764 RepID=UPI00359E21ED